MLRLRGRVVELPVRIACLYIALIDMSMLFAVKLDGDTDSQQPSCRYQQYMGLDNRPTSVRL